MAESAWAGQGIALAKLAAVQFVITTLPIGQIGYTVGNTVYIDPIAAGFGWYTGPTSAFATDGQAIAGGPAAGRMDLLTVVEHEIGHTVGLPDGCACGGYSDLMQTTLSAGLRRSLADATAAPSLSVGAWPRTPAATSLVSDTNSANYLTAVASGGSGVGTAGGAASSLGATPPGLEAPQPSDGATTLTSTPAAPTSPQAGSGGARAPPAGSVLITAAHGGTVTSGLATFSFAPGALPAAAYVSITPTTVSVPGLSVPAPAYDLVALDASTGAKIEKSNSPPVLTVAGSKPGSQVYYLDPVRGPQPIASSYDRARGAVSAGLPHSSTYVVAGGTRNITLTGPGTDSPTLRVDNSALAAIENGTLVSSAPLAGLTGVVITGSGSQNENVTVDLGGGPIPVPLTFNGGSGANSLTIAGLTAGTSWT
jgi:hypothetical protein